MSVCPWCHKPTREGVSVCPLCDKAAKVDSTDTRVSDSVDATRDFLPQPDAGEVLDSIDATLELPAASAEENSDSVDATRDFPTTLGTNTAHSSLDEPVDATRDLPGAQGAAVDADAVDATRDLPAASDSQHAADAVDATRELPAPTDLQDTVDSIEARGNFQSALPAEEPDIFGAVEKHARQAAEASNPVDSAKVGGTLGMPHIADSVDATRYLPAAGHSDDTVNATHTSANVDATIFLEGHGRGPEGKRGPKSGDDRSRTINFQSSGESGTVGRLKRLWQGAAGSSASPMHTLKSDDALATDSVFAQVAKRVLGVNESIDIAGSINTQSSSLPEKRARVQDCISIACRNSSAENADYNLIGFLGQGGMGVVLKAHQKAIGREVAIKMIQPSISQNTLSTINSQKKKFFYEAQITGKLDHPNIVPIYEVGASNEVLFYSMKMIVGTEWKDVIASKDREDNLEILMKVADAMAFAHQKQIIHRDLKPENVMLGPFGEVLVTDWGCAVDLSRKEKFTGAGSPPWMAPEMADHNVGLIGPRSDIYLLGAMLYQVIAGHPPHPGRTVFECIAAAQKNVILPVESEDPLLNIALRAMQEDPNDRYQTVEAMQDAIREYRRHAESITLAKRSEASLAQAIASNDYERFSRTIFGFQDAVELWPDNVLATKGLASARLAYGECAFAKGDYDLCLQSLDSSLPAEAELHAKAAKAKAAAEEREGRFKALRKVLAAVILAGLVVSSSLAGFAWRQWGRAEQQTVIAESEKVRATGEAQKALYAEGVARKETVSARNAWTRATQDEQRAREAERNAVAEQAKALAAQRVAEDRSAQVELGNYQSKLALSLGQVKQRDVSGAISSLKQLVDQQSYTALNALGKQPEFANWALNRVKLLSNLDLLADQPLGEIDGVAYASQANIGVVAANGQADGRQFGKLQIVTFKDAKPQLLRSIPTPADIASVSISPKGDELVYSLVTGAGPMSSAIYRLNLGDINGQPEEVTATEVQSRLPSAASLQSLLMTDEKLIGGINGGLWVWSRTNHNWQNSPPTQLKSIRGRLRSLQLLDHSRALVLAELDDHLDVHAISLDSQSPASGLLAFDIQPGSQFAREKLSAVAHANGQLILGTQSGRLFTANMSPQTLQVGPEFREILPHTHRTPIKSIRVHEAGQAMLSTADEPVVNVWQASREQLSGWQLNTALIGTPENLSGVAFMYSSSLVLGVGNEGNAIVWDVPRQKQRQQLRRVDAAGDALNYTSPVVQVVAAKDGQRAVSVHRNGTIDTWSLLTGQALPHAESAGQTHAADATQSYVGHSPGAIFVDMAVDADAGILVTSALLPGIESQLDVGQLRVWEVCKWDTQTGSMLDRWVEESATELQISLAGKSQQILYARNSETLLKQAQKNGAITFFNARLGSYFGVVHPLQKNLMITVKSNGAAGMLDTERNGGGLEIPGYRIDYAEPRNGSLLADDETPLTGQWSPDGSRFYMIWESGRITELKWENEQLSVGRDLRSQDLAELGVDLSSRANHEDLASTTIRLSSRWQVDLKVRSQDQHNLVFLGIRYPGSQHRVRLARIAFPVGEGEILASKDDQILNARAVLTDAEIPAFDRQPFRLVPVFEQDIVATQTVGDVSYLATSAGTVYQLGPSGLEHAFGRPEILAACGNSNADTIFTLQAGGGLWRADLRSGKWNWRPLANAAASSSDIRLSPDGSQLLLTATEPNGVPQLIVANAIDGSMVSTIPATACGAWNAAGELVSVTSDRSVMLHSGSELRQIGSVHSTGPIRDLMFLVEPWNDPARTSNHWVMVHTAPDGAGDGRLEYFPMTGGAAEDPIRTAAITSGATILACSPTDGVFAVGARGTIQIHFASPTLLQYGADQLFNLEGHAGADIESLTFTQDGKTLISTDTANRMFAWLSEDPVVASMPGPPDSHTRSDSKVH